MIIVLAGPMGSGKSTVAEILARKHNFARLPFAGPLKDMMRALGLSEDQVNGDLKETPTHLLDGKTPRHAMQTLGTEWGRGHISYTLWTNHWKRNAQRLVDAGRPVVAEDCRFSNELSVSHIMGGWAVYVDRPASLRGVSSEHVSEMGNLRGICDFTINNHSPTTHALEVAVDRLLAEIDTNPNTPAPAPIAG